MKITIEFSSTTEANCTIDGQEFRIEMARIFGRLGYRVGGVPEALLETTMGGLVAMEMVGFVSNIMQAEAAALEVDCDRETWDQLTDEAQDAFRERVR